VAQLWVLNRYADGESRDEGELVRGGRGGEFWREDFPQPATHEASDVGTRVAVVFAETS